MILLENIVKTYSGKNGEVEALKGVSLRLDRGGFLAITGSSGSGKTTLMNIVGCLGRQDSGRYLLDGVDISRLRGNQISRIRNEKLGFVFQGFNLISSMTALENVMLPLTIRGLPRSRARQTALEALEAVGLGDRISHRPGKLSGGQQQRVAVARVIACQTPLILADEPTGNLDSKTSAEIMGIFTELNRGGVTILLITHDPGIAKLAPSRAMLEDGRIEIL
ncbi:MAG: ABC transporter ATP-binding protein [Clostridiaceae bacterium]|nr:ABC transporter ATP-binding protein [Clostridiaceae bacterium]